MREGLEARLAVCAQLARLVLVIAHLAAVVHVLPHVFEVDRQRPQPVGVDPVFQGVLPFPCLGPEHLAQLEGVLEVGLALADGIRLVDDAGDGGRAAVMVAHDGVLFGEHGQG